MQSTGGLINDIIVFGVFIYLKLLVSGKVKLGESNQEKLNNLMERKGTLLKILVYAGTAVFAILILISLFAFKDSRQVNASKLQTQQCTLVLTQIKPTDSFFANPQWLNKYSGFKNLLSAPSGINTTLSETPFFLL